jgi:hypothetical protein
MHWSVGQFGDARLDNSGAAMLEQMTVRKTVCLKRIGGARDGELRAGRFFGHENVTADKIIDSWGETTGAAAAGRHVLAIQDTTKVKFKTTEGRRRGLGQIGHGNIHGLLAHVMIAVDADTQALLGLVDGDVWNREGTVDTPHHKRTLENRESIRWLNTAARAKRILEPAAMVTVVADRESDIYAEWATIPEDRFHVLTRAMVDRNLAGPAGGTLFAAARVFPLAGTATIEVPARQPDRAKRTATVEMRFGEVEIARPHNEKDRTLPRSVRLRLVEVREIDPPAGVEAVHWRLLTTHAVADAKAAWQIVAWYRVRWVIEQLFRVMKTQGLNVEESQLTTADRLTKLVAMAVKAACLDMLLVQERDGKHGLPAAIVFSEPEIDTIEALVPILEGKTDRQRNPHPPRGLARAAWVMARLGGWNCYYAPPGPIVMRRGRERFRAMHEGRLLGSIMEQDMRLG